MDHSLQKNAGSPAAALCAFAATRRDDGLPAEILEQVKLSLLNIFGTAIAGAQTSAISTMVRTLQPFSGQGEAIVFGRHERLDAATTAYLNAASANLHDFDDTHLPTVIHPTAPVASPLLALAQIQKTSGAAFSRAFAIGVDVACRLGQAISPEHYARGWHITSTCGIMGAAAGVGNLIGLSAAEMNNALGIAAGQASGTVENLGTDAKSVAMGNAARNGLLAALYAKQSLAGPARPVDGRFGFLTLFSNMSAAEVLLSEGLGERWELASNTFKPYPCGVVINAVIDACLAIREVLRAGPDEIASICISGDRLLLERADRRDIASGRMSQVSAQHAAAVTLLRGPPMLEAFSDRAVADAQVSELRKRVRMEHNAELPTGAAAVSVICRDGRIVTQTVLAPRGSLENPLTRADLEEKFISLSSDVLDPARQCRIIEMVGALEEIGDVRLLTDQLVPARD